MASMVTHRKVRIVTLDQDERVADNCRAGDIALQQTGTGWWIFFIDACDEVSGYDEPYPTYLKAFHTAKAAAEYGFD